MDQLAKFLKKDVPSEKSNVSGSFMCQECDELVTIGFISYEEKTLSWVCSHGHNSKVDMDV